VNEYDGIETHYERGDGRKAAINIKDYTHPPRGWYDLEPQLADTLYEQVREEWHEQAREIVRARGYDFYFCEGRSGGWLVPFYQPAARATRAYSWPGQGPSLGYPRYPDMDSIGERSRFRALQREIKALLEAVPAMLADRLEMHREDEAEEEMARIGEAH